MINFNINYLNDNNTLNSYLNVDYNRISLVEANEIATSFWSDSAVSIINNKLEISRIILQNKIVTDPNTGFMSVYADDNTTILFVVELFEDVNETNEYSGAGANVRYGIS